MRATAATPSPTSSRYTHTISSPKSRRLSMARINKVLIVGGGVGGMSLAISFARQKLAVELIDLDPDWRAVGAGLSLNNASLRAFDRVGVLGELRAHGDVHPGLRLHDIAGNPVTLSMQAGGGGL